MSRPGELSPAEVSGLRDFECPARRRWQRDARRIIRSIELAVAEDRRSITVYGHHDGPSVASVAAVEPIELGWNLIVLGVAERSVGRGLATELLQFVVAQCFTLDAVPMIWEVHRLNSEMLHVCAALGFVGQPDPEDSEFVLFQAEPAHA